MNTDTIILLIGLIGFGVIFLMAIFKKEKEDTKATPEENKSDRITKLEEEIKGLKKEIKILSLPQARILNGEDSNKGNKCPTECEMKLNNKIMGLKAEIKNDINQLKQDIKQLDDEIDYIPQYIEEDIREIVRRLLLENDRKEDGSFGENEKKFEEEQPRKHVKKSENEERKIKPTKRGNPMRP